MIVRHICNPRHRWSTTITPTTKTTYNFYIYKKSSWHAKVILETMVLLIVKRRQTKSTTVAICRVGGAHLQPTSKVVFRCNVDGTLDVVTVQPSTRVITHPSCFQAW